MGMFDAVIQSAQAQHAADRNLAQNIGQQFGAGIEQGRRKRQLVDAQLEAFADAGMIEPDEFNKLAEGNLRAKADKVLELEAFRSLQDEKLKRENLESQMSLRDQQIEEGKLRLQEGQSRLDQLESQEQLGAGIRQRIQDVEQFSSGAGVGVLSPKAQEELAAAESDPIHRMMAQAAPNLTDQQLGAFAGKLTTTIGEGAEPTAQQKDFMFARNQGFGGTFEDFLLLKKPKHTLNPQERASAAALESRLKGMEEGFKTVKEKGFAANPKIAIVERAIDLLKSGQLQTGFGAEFRGKAAKIVDAVPGFSKAAEFFGIDTKKEMTHAQLAEEFKNKTLPLALEMVELTSGAISDTEFKEFIASSANMSNTPEGNMRILLFTKFSLENSKDLAKVISRMQSKNATTAEIEQARLEFINDPKNSIVSRINDAMGIGINADDGFSLESITDQQGRIAVSGPDDVQRAIQAGAKPGTPVMMNGQIVGEIPPR
jgi:hypothetical protein